MRNALLAAILSGNPANLWVNGAFLGDDRLNDDVDMVGCGPFLTPVECSQKPLMVSCRPNGKPFMAKWQTFLTNHIHPGKPAKA